MFNLKTVLGLTAAVSCSFVTFNPAQAESTFSDDNFFGEYTGPVEGQVEPTCFTTNSPKESNCTYQIDQQPLFLDLESFTTQSGDQILIDPQLKLDIEAFPPIS